MMASLRSPRGKAHGGGQNHGTVRMTWIYISAAVADSDFQKKDGYI